MCTIVCVTFCNFASLILPARCSFRLVHLQHSRLGLCVIYDAWCFPSGVRVIAFFASRVCACVNLSWFGISRARMHRVEMETDSWQFDHGALYIRSTNGCHNNNYIILFSQREKVQSADKQWQLFALMFAHRYHTHARFARGQCFIRSQKMSSFGRQNVGPFRIEDDRTSSKYLCYETKWSDNVPYTDSAFIVRRVRNDMNESPRTDTPCNSGKEWWASDDAETFGIYKFLSLNWEEVRRERGANQIENKRS